MPEIKRILFLTFYFEPDLTAGSFRNTSLLSALQKQTSGSNIEIDVFTTQPNRYASYSKKANEREVRNHITIERIHVPKHESGLFDQMISFRKFYKEVHKRTKEKKYDLVYASSSRLFTAYLGSKISKSKGIPLYLDIRDLFVDTINDVFQKNPLLKIIKLPLKFIERKTFQRAHHINLISPGFNPYFKKYKNVELSNFTHGIDPIFIDQLQIHQGFKKGKDEKKRILYAGNIGEGQGLHKIIPEAAHAFKDEFEFIIIGDGGKKEELVSEVKRLEVENVKILNPLPRQELCNLYNEVDLLLVHLNDYEAFKKVLPSKIFELGATGKPILAGVGGYARSFLKAHLKDTHIFKPGDVSSFIELLHKVVDKEIPRIDRTDFKEKFSRERVNNEMVKSILKYL